MRIDPSRLDLRALKGAPISVLICLLVTRQAVGVEYLERETGYSDKPVSQALKMLEDRGMVQQNSRYLWQLTDSALQLPFILDLLPEGDNEDPDMGTRRNSESEKFRVGEIPSPAICDLKDSQKFDRVIEVDARETGEKMAKTTSQAPVLPESRLETPLGLGEIPSRRNSESISSGGGGGLNTEREELRNTTTTRADESENFRVNFEECRKWGIWSNVAKGLAALPHVTPAFIRAHCTTVEHGKRIPVKWAVARIRENCDVPRDWTDPETPLEETRQEVQEPGEEGEVLTEFSEAPDPEAARHWDGVLDQLQGQLQRSQFETWVASLAPFSFDDGVYTLCAANAYARDWVESRLSQTIAKLLTMVIGQPVQLHVIVDPGYQAAWMQRARS